MPRDYETYLTAARSLPLTRGNLARALVWSICHVHNQVTTGEREYVAWAEGGTLPRTLPALRHRGITEACAWAELVNLQTFARYPVARKLEVIVRNVYGLSYSKAAFALTCLGLADVACLDVHLLRKHRLPPKSAWRSAPAYLRTVATIYGRAHGSGRKQWRDYYKLVPAFRRSNHAPFFRSISVETFGQIRLEV